MARPPARGERVEVIRCKTIRKRIGIACHIGFKNNRALAVDDTHCGLLDRDIQGSIENHGGLLWQLRAVWLKTRPMTACPITPVFCLAEPRVGQVRASRG